MTCVGVGNATQRTCQLRRCKHSAAASSHHTQRKHARDATRPKKRPHLPSFAPPAAVTTVSASHAKGAAEIAARGISVTKEIAYATVLGLAGGAVFKARVRALAAHVGREKARCRPMSSRARTVARVAVAPQRRPAPEARCKAAGRGALQQAATDAAAAAPAAAATPVAQTQVRKAPRNAAFGSGTRLGPQRAAPPPQPRSAAYPPRAQPPRPLSTRAAGLYQACPRHISSAP
jgi:hypothetical protein